jgi:dTDP-4-amino-4,6-dideoxygalactose transaminase
MSALPTLALLGGEPLFKCALTTGQLANRDPERFFELARGAFERRTESASDTLARRLEEHVAEMHGCTHAVSFANACYALMLVLSELARGPGTEVLLPALTFRGLPHLIRWAGLTPDYVDIDPLRHTLDPAALAAQIGPDTAAVLAVDNVHALCDIDAIESIAQRQGVPLVMDCVYAVGGHYPSGVVGSRGQAAVFSLHATKLINGFEGGYLTTNDGALAGALRRLRAGGVSKGSDKTPALACPLNETHAAMALANLPHRAAIIEDNRLRMQHYHQRFADLPWIDFADERHGPGNHGLVLLRVLPEAPFSRDELVRILRAENALVRPYYAPPLHIALPAAGEKPPAPCPVSEACADAFIQMPVGDRVTLAHIDQLRTLFERLDRQGAACRQQLRQPVAGAQA